jgi:hypothetical protein
MLQTKKFRRNGLSVTVNIRVKTSSAGVAPPGEPNWHNGRREVKFLKLDFPVPGGCLLIICHSGLIAA